MLNSLLLLAVFALGVIFGLLVAYVLKLSYAKNVENLAEQILSESEKRHQAEQQVLMSTVQNNFGKLSMAVLKKSTDQFLELAEQRMNTETVKNSAELSGKKQLIDQQLNTMAGELSKVTALVKAFEADRMEKFGALSQEISSLSQTSALIHRAIADSRSRGQWGERIAEDILRLAGFIEGVNYRRQNSIDGSRPDYTFILPKNLTLNMDVKFPLDNYMKHVNATSAADQEKYRKDFIRDVRARVGEVVKRGYINTEQSTIDCVLVFIPNEQIYRFIHEEDSQLIEAALRQKVILCSPLTLFIVLAVVRQAAENFAIEKSSREILTILNNFKKQWGNFVEKMEQVEKLHRRTTEAYADLTGTRTKALDRSLRNIDTLVVEYKAQDSNFSMSLLEEVATSDPEFLSISEEDSITS